MNVIESDDYRKARQAIAADPIMKQMVIEFWVAVIEKKVDEQAQIGMSFMMGVAKEYYCRGGKIDGYGMGDHQKAFQKMFEEMRFVFGEAVN